MIAAIDLGGSKCAVALGNANGTVRSQARFPTEPERGPEAVIAQMVLTLKGLAAACPEPLERVAVASVGPLDPDTGTLLAPPNFPGWDHVPLQAELSRALGVPVVIDNDANAAAWAEYRWGAGQGSAAMVYVTVSTGIGGGIVLNGALWRGLGSGAGELGHQTIMADNGPLCGCGNHGCLEALASGTAIVRAARQVLSPQRTPKLWQLCGGETQALRATDVARAASEGEADARRIWDRAVADLAIGLANVITTIAPDCVVIGGGVATAGDLLLTPLRAALRQRVRLVPVKDIRLTTATFIQDAGLMGALALAINDSGANTHPSPAAT